MKGFVSIALRWATSLYILLYLVVFVYIISSTNLINCKESVLMTKKYCERSPDKVFFPASVNFGISAIYPDGL